MLSQMGAIMPPAAKLASRPLTARSKSVTRAPREASSQAQDSPMAPPPIIATSAKDAPKDCISPQYKEEPPVKARANCKHLLTIRAGHYALHAVKSRCKVNIRLYLSD